MLERIMYVDDEDDIRTVAAMALEKIGGFQLSLHENGADALAAIGDFDPQLILLDVMMPGLDGPSVLRALRDDPAFAAIPVAFMTAKIRAEEIASLMAMGAVGVIAKPFDPMQLSNEVRMIWRAAEAGLPYSPPPSLGGDNR